MIYWQLFLSFLQIGALSFGGGYAAMPLLESQIVTSHSWLTMTEFANLVTIAEMTPGPIAVNAATFVGTKIGGVPGALVATAGCILPACILVTLIAKLYLKYRNLSVLQSVLGSLRPAVGRRHDFDEPLLGWAHGGTRKHEFSHGGDFCALLFAAAQDKIKPHRRYGAGRGAEPCGGVHRTLNML